jgi:hypothetical protein
VLSSLNLFSKFQLEKDKRKRHPEIENNVVCWALLNGFLPILLTKDKRDPISETLCIICILGPQKINQKPSSPKFIKN